MFENSYDIGFSGPVGVSDNSVWVLISLVVAVIGGICLYFTVFSR